MTDQNNLGRAKKGVGRVQKTNKRERERKEFEKSSNVRGPDDIKKENETKDARSYMRRGTLLK